ncbi:MAG TPA: VWA domain-containing protein [Candidatus Angelobacter sp.]|nr:VWA domain-containing protein [Candidatus Angelobacter sp.]
MSRTKVIILALLALVWVCNRPLHAAAADPGSGNAGAQQAASSSQKDAEGAVPVFKVATRMVLVDAVVTDKSGKPVAGLKPADFEVFENGKKQEIRAFGATTAQSGPAVAPRTLPSDLFTNTVELQPQEGPPVILLIDALNTPWADQVYGREQLVKYLSGHKAQRNIAIYVLGNRLQLLQDFTEDPALVRQAVLEKGLNPNHLDPNATSNTLNQQLIEMEKTVTNSSRDIATISTLEALNSIARHAAAVPGRKQLLWLSSGFPLDLDTVKTSIYYQQMTETANLLTDAQVAVYPVDVRGLVAFFPREMSSGMARLTSAHLTMDELALKTGGLAFYGHNDISRLVDRAVADGATYYVLGYYPTNKDWNGDFRSIQVKLHSPELKVRSRKGYFAINTSSASESKMKAERSEFLKALAPDALSAGMLPMFVQVIPPTKEHSQVFLEVRVDPRSVIFDAGPDNHRQGELEVFTAVLDSKGKFVTNKLDTLKTNLPPDTFAKVMASSLAVRQEFDLSPGKYLLKVGARDVKSNLFGTVTAEVDVPAQN